MIPGKIERRKIMTKHKAGDRVRIRSKEWIEAQERGRYGWISGSGHYCMNEKMFQYAGMIATIIEFCGPKYMTGNDIFYYCLNIDRNDPQRWEDWMFDPDYNPDEPLSVEDAVKAMLDGETLYDDEGYEYRWDNEIGRFEARLDSRAEFKAFMVSGFYRRPKKRKRKMTSSEAVIWAESDESLGWMVKYDGHWKFPRSLGFSSGTEFYQRARLLPDLSGIDESTIQGFEVEE
jgi:hypothetical protein